ncbi:MmgE/PrpD family protein [Humitalea sp. 24SJ18S-53]|uniref:MmgE/PrpD family protein n=1 Tax=Humitalea sp. 24SJ18S-53 TaxID=3422307 RepID=UPI003D66930E
MTAPPAAVELARFYAGLDGAALPGATIHAVRRHLLDTLGAALAGAAQPEPSAVLAAGRVTHGATGPSVLWGRPESVPPALAALVNGTAAHALELDDASGCDHSGAVVVPAVLAALPLARAVSAGDLIAAIVAGYDLGRRVMEAAGGYDAHNGAGWHSTGTCGVFGAAAAVARLWRLDAGVTQHALGLAGSFASGNWAFMADGAMTKRLHPGHAASAGLMAAALARAGMTGPAAIFDAPWGGFLATYARGAADPGALTRDLGRDFRIHRSSIKPFASCRGTHAAVELALDLRRQVAAEDVGAIEAGVHPTLVKMCGATEAATMLEAQMSMPYALAVAWLRGDAGLADFAPEVRAAPEVACFMRRVRLIEDPSVPSNIACRLTVTPRAGAPLEARRDVPIGSWNHPLPDDAVRQKFRGLATPVLGDDRAAALEARVMGLTPTDDPTIITDLLERAA